MVYVGLARVSTNLTEQISTRFQDGFQEKSRTCFMMFALLRPTMQCLEIIFLGYPVSQKPTTLKNL